MNTHAISLGFLLAGALSLPAHASSYLHGLINWQAMTWTTTGDITLDVETVSYSSTLWPGCCGGVVSDPDGITFAAPDRYGSVSNQPGQLSVEMFNESTQSDMSFDTKRTLLLQLNGSGSVTFSIPWELRWEADGQGAAGVHLSLAGLSGQEYMNMDGLTLGNSKGATSGNFLFTVTGNGAVRDYPLIGRLYGGVSAVPEPEVWAGMLAGLGGMALLRRRRNGAQRKSSQAV